ncbi:MAG TPA: GNAT family N-acetyltransferase [Pseudolabrys sp.]|nr:GNAT family N-acetyltransferase [Pseudolabrys sp.]
MYIKERPWKAWIAASDGLSTGMPSTVRQNRALSRFELDAGGAVVFANYKLDEGVVTFLHTETPPSLRGRGIASQLLKGALELARAQGFKVVPRCSFVRAYLAQHPEFADLLARS